MKTSNLRDENGKIYYGWWIVLITGLIAAFVYNGIVCLAGIFLLPITTETGISIGAFSVCLSISAIVGALCLIFLNRLMTKEKMKKTMIIAGFLGIIGCIGFAMSTEIWHFYLSSILTGACFGLFTSTPCTVLINNWFGFKMVGKATTIYLAFMCGGYTVMAMACTYLMTIASWRVAYYIIAGTILISVIFVAKLFVWSPAEKGLKRMGETEEERNFDPSTRPGMTFATAIKKPYTWVVFLAIILFVIGSGSVLQHSIATMVLAGFDPMFATTIVSGLTVIMMFSLPVAGWFCDKVGTPIGATVLGLLFTVAMLAFAFMNGSVALVIIMAIPYMFGIASVNLVSPLVARYLYGEKEFGKIVSYVNVFVGLGGVFGPPIAGAIVTATGSYKPAWLVIAACVLLGTIIRFIFVREKFRFTSIENTESVDTSEPIESPETATATV